MTIQVKSFLILLFPRVPKLAGQPTQLPKTSISGSLTIVLKMEQLDLKLRSRPEVVGARTFLLNKELKGSADKKAGPFCVL